MTQDGSMITKGNMFPLNKDNIPVVTFGFLSQVTLSFAEFLLLCVNYHLKIKHLWDTREQPEMNTILPTAGGPCNAAEPAEAKGLGCMGTAAGTDT